MAREDTIKSNNGALQKYRRQIRNFEATMREKGGLEGEGTYDTKFTEFRALQAKIASKGRSSTNARAQLKAQRQVLTAFDQAYKPLFERCEELASDLSSLATAARSDEDISAEANKLIDSSSSVLYKDFSELPLPERPELKTVPAATDTDDASASADASSSSTPGPGSGPG